MHDSLYKQRQFECSSLITVVTLLTFAFCGHAVFATSSSAAKQKVTDTVLDASLSLSRERSARGLAEQGVGYALYI